MAGEPLSFRAFRAARPAGCEYGYGHGDGLNQLRDREFPRLRGITYLDHAGSALFPESLLKAFTDDLRNNVYGNPHSQNISSKLTYDTIEHVRYRILQHFHTTAEDYTIIFTSGCTAALKLIAESFPWIPEGTKQPSSRFCYLTDSHTSVVGMRGITASMNVLSIPVKPKEVLLAKSRLPAEEQNCTTPHLFSYPAQSNFSGTKYPLSWIQDIKSGKLCPIKIPGKWFILLDAASYVSSSPLDLGVHQADFIPISFYKIFGFPTGLGALLVNNRIAPLLRKTYFGGGTAAAYLAGEDFYFPRKSISERFEDGTVPFLDIIALKHGFDVLEKLTGGMEKIKQHTFALAHYTYTVLSNLKYANGAPVVRIYSDTDFSSPDVQGPIINFNVLNENGEVLGFSQWLVIKSFFIDLYHLDFAVHQILIISGMGNQELSSMSGKPRLTYLNGRGRMETIRWLLAAAGVEFEEVYLETKEQYDKLIKDGFLLFQQVPLVEIDGMKMVQTRAILSYIAGKYNLYGKDLKERALIDMYVEGISDLMQMILMFPFSPPDAKEKNLDSIKERATNRYFPVFEKVLKQHGQDFLVGNKFSWADVQLMEAILAVEERIPAVLSGFPQLQVFKTKMSNMPTIKKFLQPGSPRKPPPDDHYVETVLKVFKK